MGNTLQCHDLEFPLHTFEKEEEIFYLYDEISYLNMLEEIFNKRFHEINISIKNSVIPQNVLKEKIALLTEYYNRRINFRIGQVLQIVNEEINPTYIDILKRYWGKSTFRTLKIYNERLLEKGEKAIIEVSQGQIISDVISQVESCIQGKDYRDIFVTAPTGAGKSVMFQIPAIYLAEKYELFTIVISPLIGLMKDQVNNLENKDYKHARTINSDISPIKKQEIIQEIENKQCHILYLSPESLLSKSDLDNIIGHRKLGLFVVDEAHIVTTWGKQFRPDYWYLGDYIDKMRKSQLEKKQMGFIISTFTATAIYGGIENMYEETVQSLRLIDPITYLGYVKRDDIRIKVEKTQLNKDKNKVEYELDKFDQLKNKIDLSLIRNKKMLIYFPTVALINRFYTYCIANGLGRYVAKYHGQLEGFEKDENYEAFLSGSKLIMLATKAFGMGIDIDNIEVVSHFAPTGTVCDYVQEIGRAARRPTLTGEAVYQFMSNDFKYINKLHGLSTLREYQLVEVIKKVYELFIYERGRVDGRKKKNQMLVDAECFTYIFDNGLSSEDDQINKVKTALLMIQKDFERRFAYSPFTVRPIPMFEVGYFEINPDIQKKINRRYGDIIQVVSLQKNICSMSLKAIWEKEFSCDLSFPKFKYLLYSKDQSLKFNYLNDITPALQVDIYFKNNYINHFEVMMSGIRSIINEAIRTKKYYTVDELSLLLVEKAALSKRQCEAIMDILLSVLKKYSEEIYNCMNGRLYFAKPLNDGSVKYQFLNNCQKFLKWIDNGFKYINTHIEDGKLYLINNTVTSSFKEYMLLMGLLEAFGILTFKSLGGKNSQIYIYVNQTQTLKNIKDRPNSYKNRLVEMVAERHYISVEMLTFLFNNNFSSEEIWEHLENYFLGTIPKEVIVAYEKRTNKKLILNGMN